jgi:hypothetical protein
VYRISPALFSLFNTLQNILIEFEPTKPLLGTPRDFKNWYCELSGGEKDAVHGDLVESYLRLSEKEQLSALQNEEGIVRPELLCILKALSVDDSQDLMEDVSEDPKNYVYFITSLLSGFERYR